MGVPASKIVQAVEQKTVAICGNPNCGKTTIFNAITGLNQKIANYPGVTVERVSGQFSLGGKNYTLVDIPGAYSLSAFSPDEEIAASALFGNLKGSTFPDIIICVIDTTNLERGLYFLYQVLQIGQPVIVALNMIDISERKGINIDSQKLSHLLGGTPVVPIVASKGKGIERLKSEVSGLCATPFCPTGVRYDQHTERILAGALSRSLDNSITRAECLRLLFDCEKNESSEIASKIGVEAAGFVGSERTKLKETIGSVIAIETKVLTDRSSHLYNNVVTQSNEGKKTRSDGVDRILLNPIIGPIILVSMMFIVFQSIFSWAEPFMGMIDSLFGSIGSMVENSMAEGPLRSLLVDGIIGGVGSVLIFIPQIAILFIFISLLEDSGYMARAAFLVDRMFRWCGLSGKSFIPMLSSFACAIPGIMATRTIEDRKLRFITIMVSPLMTCSARLPVYAVMIAAFVPFQVYFGVFNLQGIVLSLLYLLGVVVAVLVSFVLNKTIMKVEKGTFLMEMPSYKIPTLKSVVIRVLNRLKTFIIRAGTVIMAITIVIWALSYYPRPEALIVKQQTENSQLANQQTNETRAYQSIAAVLITEPSNAQLLNQYRAVFAEVSDVEGLEIERAQLLSQYPSNKDIIDFAYGEATLTVEHYLISSKLTNEHTGEMLRQSYFGRIGRTIEPAFKPLGWDWKITMSVLASFPAREVIIATIGTIYNLGSDVDDESSSLIDKLRSAKWEEGSNIGQPVFTPAVALSIMVFFALCCQCGATLVTIKQETASLGYPLFVFVYMTTLAYLAAFVTFNLFSGIGL